jgi:hypothetical protein
MVAMLLIGWTAVSTAMALILGLAARKLKQYYRNQSRGRTDCSGMGSIRPKSSLDDRGYESRLNQVTHKPPVQPVSDQMDLNIDCLDQADLSNRPAT